MRRTLLPLPTLQPALELRMPPDARTADGESWQAIERDVLALFDAYAAGLRRYVRSCGLGVEESEDVLQDVFLSLFRHLRLGRPRSNLKGWLFEVAHNLALKQRQKSLRRQQTEVAGDDSLAERIIDPAADPEVRLSDEQRRHRLRSVLRTMPERDRHCLYLRAEGLCYRDIARALNVSLGSVAKSISRAVSRLSHADKG